MPLSVAAQLALRETFGAGAENLIEDLNSILAGNLDNLSVDTEDLAVGCLSATADGRAAMAVGYFDEATFDDKVQDAALTEAILTAKVLNNAVTAAVLAAKVQDAAYTQAVVDAKVIDGGINPVAKLVPGAAGVAPVAGAVLNLQIPAPAGAGNTDFNMPDVFNWRVLDVWTVSDGATAGAGDTAQLQTAAGAGNVSDAIVVAPGAADTMVRATQLFAANEVFAPGAGARVATASGTNNPGCRFNITIMAETP